MKIPFRGHEVIRISRIEVLSEGRSFIDVKVQNPIVLIVVHVG